MKRWNKILIDRSDKITKINKAKSYKDFAEELGGDNSNQYYKNKKIFFEFYLNERYLIWDNYLKKKFESKNKNFNNSQW